MESRKILRELYEDIWAFQIPKNDDQRIRSSHSSSLYGEIKHGSVEKLIHYLKPKKNDVFYDLGSGVGKVVIQMALDTQISKIVGIELSSTRFKAAEKIRREVEKREFISKGRVRFRNSDVMKANLNDATIIYTCSTAFPNRFMKDLEIKLGSLKGNPTIISLRDFDGHSSLTLVDILKLDMTWARKVPLYVYRK